MIMFTLGNDKGSILLHSLVVMLFIFSLLLITLELEYKKYIHARSQYENLENLYEKSSSDDLFIRWNEK